MSRKCELEADQYALELEAKIGIHSEAAASMMQKFNKFDNGQLEIISTHPLSDVREKAIVNESMRLKGLMTPEELLHNRKKIEKAIVLFNKMKTQRESIIKRLSKSLALG